MKECDLFKRTEMFYHDDDICYTFNHKGDHYGTSLNPKLGLNFILNYRLARMKDSDADQYATVILHPPGTLPDPNQFIANSHKITPKSHVFIGVKASLIEVSKTFQKLDEKQQQCKLNIDENKGYHHINCQMTNSLKKAQKNCKCRPWFYPGNESICFSTSLKCFNEIMKNESKYLWSPKCPQACAFAEYELNVKEKVLDGIKAAVFSVWNSPTQKSAGYFLDFKFLSKCFPLPGFEPATSWVTSHHMPFFLVKG